MNNYNSSNIYYDTHSIYTFACKYTKENLTIIPIKPQAKEPLIKWTKYQRDKPDQNQIDLWFKDRTADQIGIGVVLKNGLIGIDFDKPELMPFILGDKDPREFTWVVQTNKGIHVYLRAKDIRNNVEIPGVVEIKAKHKYLIAPPSIHPEGSEYKWLMDINKIPIFELNVEQEKLLCDRMVFLKKNWELIEILNKAWKQGQRNQMALYIAGILRKVGWKRDKTSDLLWILCLLNNDKEEDNRLSAVESTYDQVIKNIAGISKLKELLNEDDINNIKKLLKVDKQGKKRTSDAEILKELESRGVFFRNHEHDFFYKYSETVFIDSIYFEKIVGDYYEQITSKLINKERLNKIKDAAKRRALDGKEYKTFNRIGINGEKIYYYLGRFNNKTKIIEISNSGWKILDNEPDNIFFKRYKHTSNQVIPLINKDFNVDLFLREIFNLKTEKDFQLFKVWLISCFIPEIAHPLLNLYGSEGSGKTKFLEFVRQIIDPSPVLTSALPNNQRDINLNLFHNYICCFDNLSRLNTKDAPNIADHLSRSVTGQGLSERLLFTNDEEKIYVDKTIVCINGINQLIQNPDLADRSLTFELERIKKYIPDSILTKYFKKNLPYLLGYIFNIIVQTLTCNEPPIDDLKSIRLSDFGYWGYKIADVIGWNGKDFLKTFKDQGATLKTGLANEDDLIVAIVEFIDKEKQWCGKSKDLLFKLKNKEDETLNLKLPHNGATLTRKLNRFKQVLYELGVKYNYFSWKRQICLKLMYQTTGSADDKNDNGPHDLRVLTRENQYKNDKDPRHLRDMRNISSKKEFLKREQLTGIVHDQKKRKEVGENSVVSRAAIDPDSRVPKHVPKVSRADSDYHQDNQEYILSNLQDIYNSIHHKNPISKVDISLFLQKCNDIIKEEFKKYNHKDLQEFAYIIYKKYFEPKNLTIDLCKSKIKEVLMNLKNTNTSDNHNKEEDIYLPFKKTGNNLLSKKVYVIELIEADIKQNEAQRLLEKGIKDNLITDQGDGYIYAYVNKE